MPALVKLDPRLRQELQHGRRVATRVLRDGKVLVDPSYVAGVTALLAPQDAGSLSTFMGVTDWPAGNVPRLAEIRPSAGCGLDAACADVVGFGGGSVAELGYLDHGQRVYDREGELRRCTMY